MPLPSLIELSRDAGPIGQVLSGLEDWMLRAADRFGEQTWEAERKRNNPKRLPFPDPWQYLLDAPAVSEDAKHVLRAAQSQLYGFRRLARVAVRVATYNTDWYAEAAASQAADNEQRFAHSIRKVSDGLFGYEPVRREMEERAQRDPKF